MNISLSDLRHTYSLVAGERFRSSVERHVRGLGGATDRAFAPGDRRRRTHGAARRVRVGRLPGAWRHPPRWAATSPRRSRGRRRRRTDVRLPMVRRVDERRVVGRSSPRLVVRTVEVRRRVLAGRRGGVKAISIACVSVRSRHGNIAHARINTGRRARRDLVAWNANVAIAVRALVRVTPVRVDPALEAISRSGPSSSWMSSIGREEGDDAVGREWPTRTPPRPSSGSARGRGAERPPSAHGHCARDGGRDETPRQGEGSPKRAARRARPT